MILFPNATCLINGEWVSGQALIDVRNPADDSLVGQVPSLGATETEQAIEAARLAMPAWAARTAADRGQVLETFYDLLIAHEAELGAVLTAEQGKPLAEARGEIRYAAAYVKWFAEEGRRAYGEVIPSHDPQKRLLVIKQPVGVVAAITPWNFPAAMIARKVAPALAAGCTIVVKPAEQTPRTALALAALALKAGVPAGVFNVITGPSREIGKVLTDSPVVAKLTFTGSTQVGAQLYRQSADTIKKLSLELGGNAPFIVFDDADLDKAVDGAILSKYRNAGQTCVCANRFYVQAGIYDRFIEAFAARAASLKLAAGDQDGAEVGPLIDDAAFNKVSSLIEQAITEGARKVTGGAAPEVGSRFMRPTVLADVRADMGITTEEIFGPVAPVVRFEGEAEVIAMANDSPYGLAGYFYSQNLSRAWRVAEALEVGMVGVNTGLISTEVAPFGGVKASGLGREGARQGLEDYLETKFVCMGL